MADSLVFESTCELFEAETGLDRIVARGTIRIALKEFGLDPRTVTSEQMEAILLKVLPERLSRLGVEALDGLCERVADGVKALPAPGRETDSLDAVFDRINETRRGSRG